jgi:hypothetical protein
MPDFALIPIADWTVSARLERAERNRLLANEEFSALVARISASARVVHAQRTTSRQHRGHWRIEIVLEAAGDDIRAFHSSRFGYRAQYFASVPAGDLANAYAVQALTGDVEKIVAKRRLVKSEIEASLRAASAKIWIHQGRWFRERRREDRVILVERWQAGLSSSDSEARRKAVWASLHPDETRLDIKGGWISPDGVELVGPKPSRGCEIRDLGFT